MLPGRRVVGGGEGQGRRREGARERGGVSVGKIMDDIGRVGDIGEGRDGKGW